MILLYPENEKEFDNNGLGAISDAISCTVTEERNGLFESEIQYPVSGLHYSEIKNRSIIFVKPNPYREPEPFRIYRITKPLSGQVTIYAQHISYDLSGIPVSPFSAGSVVAAFSNFQTQSAIDNPFTFWTDKTSQGSFTVEVPSSIRSLLGGSEGSILDVYGGEYEFTRWTVKLWENRGQNNGVAIRYGKNLTDLQQDENISNIATGVYPYWKGFGEDTALVELPEKIVNAPGTYSFQKIIPLDLSQEFEEQPTEEQLRERAEKYVSDNNIGIPTVSIEVSFQPLEQTEEYKDIALLERVNLCDTVTVEYPELGVSATAKCVKTVYDALKDRYISIELGEAKTNIADTIANQQQEIEAAPSVSFVQQAIFNATNLITGNKGGYVVLRDTNGDKEPDEILIMDTPDVNTAQKVWRWNNGGLGFSKTGYNGPYSTAITQDGAIVADFITAGTFNGNLIKTGRIESHDGKVYFDLDAAELVASEIIGVDSRYILNIGNGSTSQYGPGLIFKKSGEEKMEVFSSDDKIIVRFNGKTGEQITAENDYDCLSLNGGNAGIDLSDDEIYITCHRKGIDDFDEIHISSDEIRFSLGNSSDTTGMQFRMDKSNNEFNFIIDNSVVAYIDSTGFHNA